MKSLGILSFVCEKGEFLEKLSLWLNFSVSWENFLSSINFIISSNLESEEVIYAL